MSQVLLHLEFTGDRGAHSDLMVKLGASEYISDSYYLAIDDAPTAARTLPQQLARLLQQWEQRVQQLKPAGGTAFLPFDFSDESTGWLRVTSPDGHRARVEGGDSRRIAGWSFSPSDLARTAPSVTDFRPDVGTAMDCHIDELLAAIANNRDEFTHGPCAPSSR